MNGNDDDNILRCEWRGKGGEEEEEIKKQKMEIMKKIKLPL